MPATATETKPAPKFQHRQKVRVSPEVHDQQQAEIVGSEWGPDKGQGKRGPSWVYYLKFPGEEEWWLATEEELISWSE